MSIKVSFADLTHTGQVVATNTFPLGALMIAAYAKKNLGDEIDFEVFRYPEDFSSYLETNTPKIACFSIFAWNMHLSHEYARRLKEVSPETITIFGGPNYPNGVVEQTDFLEKYPAIDFAVEGEGELVFLDIFEKLKGYNFDAEALKADHVEIANTAYLTGGEYVAGKVLPRIQVLDDIPSTFENGLSDKFFDDHLIPMIQSARGCPYSCTFCHEGSLYFNKTRRTSMDRVKWELDYIAERVKVPDFIITDLNFGMFQEDIETSKYLRELQVERDWPRFVTIATAKNHKERVVDISNILQGSLPPGAAVQSTDPEVLGIIKRKNLPLDAVREVARTAETDGAVSFSEVILCLPGDSRRAHFKSITDVLDAGFTLVRTYQFMLLAGTEAAGNKSREDFEMDSRFRVKPMNFGVYDFRGEQFASAEIEEICVANKTMPYEDYTSCRGLSLTVEIFNNNGLFFDLVQFLARNGIQRSELIMSIYDSIESNDGIVGQFYKDFAEEEARNLWDSEDDLRDFVQSEGTIQRYLDTEYGTNEIYKYRALAVFEHMDELNRIAFDTGLELLKEVGADTPENLEYYEDLRRFSVLRKRKLFDIDNRLSDEFNYDMVQMLQSNFVLSPEEVKFKKGSQVVELFHTDSQKDLITGYIRQFGDDLIGLGRILNRAHISAMYRSANYKGGGAEKTVTTGINTSASSRVIHEAGGA